MSRWPRCEAEVEELLSSGQLQHVRGGSETAARLMEKAQQTLRTAQEVLAKDPDNGYTLAYDAARYAGTALLAQQGLRPTSMGGHYAVEQALRAQFGPGFKYFGVLRRRGNELEYPSAEVGPATADEAAQALDDATNLCAAATKLFSALTVF